MSAHKADVTVAVETVPSRLVDLPAASRYLGGVSTWTIRQWIADGLLPVFKPPSMRQTDAHGVPTREPMRKILIDVRDLDALVEKWKMRNI